MATAPHVNGVASISLGTGGSGALELLGYSLNGVELDWNDLRDPIYDDRGGGEGMLPVDFSEIGETCVITADVITYDEAVLAKIRKRPGASAEGLLSSPGRLMGASGDLYRVLIASPLDTLPWNFPTAFLRRKPVRVSTRRSVWRLQWFAFAYLGAATSAAGGVLYNRTAS